MLLGTKVYDEKIDVWAAGCILTEMVLGKPIFKARS
jgi:serine/threonine protein kinase